MKLNTAPLRCTTKYCKGLVNVVAARYGNGRTALQIYTATIPPEPELTASVNLPDAPCGVGEIYIKEYSENEGVTAFLVAAGIIEPAVLAQVPSGYVIISRYRLTPSIINKLKEGS